MQHNQVTSRLQCRKSSKVFSTKSNLRKHQRSVRCDKKKKYAMKLAISSDFIYIYPSIVAIFHYIFSIIHRKSNEVIVKQEDKKVNLDFRLVSYDLRSKK